MSEIRDEWLDAAARAICDNEGHEGDDWYYWREAAQAALSAVSPLIAEEARRECERRMADALLKRIDELRAELDAVPVEMFDKFQDVQNRKHEAEYIVAVCLPAIRQEPT